MARPELLRENRSVVVMKRRDHFHFIIVAETKQEQRVAQFTCHLGMCLCVHLTGVAYSSAPNRIER